MNETLLTEIESQIANIRELQDRDKEIIGIDNHSMAIKYARKIKECSEKLIVVNKVGV